MTPPGSPDSRRVAVLSLHDQFGRHLEGMRIVLDLENLRGGWSAQTDRYLLPCQIVDGDGLTIEFFAKFQILPRPENDR